MDTDTDPSQSQDPVNRKTRSKHKQDKGKKEKRSSKPSVRVSQRAGLILSTSRVKRSMKRIHKSRTSSSSSIFLTGVVQQFARALIVRAIRLMGKESVQRPGPDAGEKALAKYNKIAHKRLDPRILYQAMVSDPSISSFISQNNGLVVGAGVLPTATTNLDREKQLRQQIKQIKTQAHQKIRMIREQSGEEEEEHEEEQHKKKKKKKKSSSK